MDRRTYVAALGAAAASLSGFAVATDARQLPMLGSGERGEGEPVSVNRRITDEGVTYLEDTDEVRYVAFYADGEPAEYETEPFETWAKRKCAAVGSTVVLPAVEERLSAAVDGVGNGTESRLFGTVISVDYVTGSDEGATETSGERVSFADLVDVTPRTVNAAVSLDDREHERAVPVVVQRVERATAD